MKNCLDIKINNTKFVSNKYENLYSGFKSLMRKLDKRG